MWSLILTIFTVVVFLFSIGFCVWFSCRRGWFNTALRFGCFLLGGLISFGLVKLLSPVLISSVMPLVTEGLEEEVLKIINLPTLQTLITKLAAGIISPLLFVIVFFLVEKLTFFIYIPLKKKFADNEKLHGMPHDKLYGALLGVALAIITTITWMMPISGYTYFAGDTIATLGKVELVEIPQETLDLADEFVSTPIAKIDHAATGWLFRSLSTDLTKTVNAVASVAEMADSFGQDLSSGNIPFDKIAELLSSKEVATFAIGLVRDVLPTVVPTDDPVASKVVTAVSDGLDQLLEAQKSMSDEEFQKEVTAITDVIKLAQSSDIDSTVTVVKTILKSKYISEAVAEQSESILQGLNGESIPLSNAEKQELKNLINEYDFDSKVENLVNQLFALQ